MLILTDPGGPTQPRGILALIARRQELEAAVDAVDGAEAEAHIAELAAVMAEIDRVLCGAAPAARPIFRRRRWRR